MCFELHQWLLEGDLLLVIQKKSEQIQTFLLSESCISIIHHDTSRRPNDTTKQTLNNTVATAKILIMWSPNVTLKIRVALKLVQKGDRKQEVYNWWPNLLPL